MMADGDATNFSDRDRRMLDEIKLELADPSRRVIAFVGSGLSRLKPANLPGWIELADQVLQEVSDQYGIESDQAKEAASYWEACKHAKYDVDFLILAYKKFSDILGVESFKSSIQRALRVDDDKIPLLTRKLLDLGFSGVITTNLDQILERAAKMERPFENIVRGPRAHSQALARQTNWLWKVHGCVTDPDDWIFTTESYITARSPDHPYVRNLRVLAQGSRMVFFGFGGSDPNISWLMDTLRVEYGPRPDQHVIVARKPEDIGADFVRNVRPVYYGGDDYEAGLSRVIDALARKRTQTGILISHSPNEQDLRRKLIGTLPSHTPPPFAVELFGKRVADQLPIAQAERSLQERVGKVGQFSVSPTAISQRDLEAVGGFIVAGDALSGRSTLVGEVADTWSKSADGRLVLFIDGGRLRTLAKRRITTLEEAIALWLHHLNALEPAEEGLLLKSDKKAIVIDDLDLLVGADSVAQFLTSQVDVPVERGQLRFACSVADPSIGYLGALPFCQCLGLSDRGIEEYVTHWVTEFRKVGLGRDGATRTKELYELIVSDNYLYEIAKYPPILGEIIGYALSTGSADLSANSLVSQVINRLVGRASRSSGLPGLQALDLMKALSWEIVTAPVPSTYRVSIDRALAVAEKTVESLRSAPKEATVEAILRCGVFRAEGMGEIGAANRTIVGLLAAAHCASGVAASGEPLEWVERAIAANAYDVLDRLPVSLSSHIDLRKGMAVSLSDQVLAAAPGQSVDTALLLARLVELPGIHGSPVLENPKIDAVRKRLRANAEDREKYSVRQRERLSTAISILNQARGEVQDIEWVRIEPREVKLAKSMSDFSGRPWSSSWLQFAETPYALTKTPITVDQFASFVEDDGYRNNRWWTGEGWAWLQAQRATSPSAWVRQKVRLRTPVVGVNWHEASAFVSWRSQVDNASAPYSLPSEAEWHFAAAEHMCASGAALFPWGSDRPNSGDLAEINWAGTGILRPLPVGLFPQSSTPSGLIDMYGNVEEWCADQWSLPPNFQSNVQVDTFDPRRFRVVRGGSAIRAGIMCSPAYRSRCLTEQRYPTIGFRLSRKEIQ